MLFFGLAVTVNFLWQIIRKPSEILAIVGLGAARSPHQLWRDYGQKFVSYQTELMPAPLLAAIAFAESSGNPLATPKWEWNWRGGLLDLYAPASTSVGMFQFTNSTFKEASQYCVVNGQVVADGPWYDFRSCWFNSLYTRLSASDSIQLTSAYLHKEIEHWQIINGRRDLAKSLITRMAAVIHLCGPGKASKALSIQGAGNCGSHSVRGYVAKVEHFERIFRKEYLASLRN
jgi:hypothetical protein